MIKTRRTSQNKLISGINITPLTDVCLVLMIIFMVTAPQLVQSQEKGIDVPLPSVSKSIPLPSTPLIVRIEQGPKVSFNGEPTTFEALESNIKAKLAEYPKDDHSQKTLIVKADEKIQYRYVAHALDIAGKSGISNTFLATRDPESTR